MPLRTAILGCGGFANTHARNITSLKEDFEFVAFCDSNESRGRAFSEKYTDGGAVVFTDHHRLFDQARLDLAVICLPPYGHSAEVEAAAARGVHLLMEKPIALTSEHAWRMVETSEKAGIKTQVGFMFRFGEAVELSFRMPTTLPSSTPTSRTSPPKRLSLSGIFTWKDCSTC